MLRAFVWRGLKRMEGVREGEEDGGERSRLLDWYYSQQTTVGGAQSEMLWTPPHPGFLAVEWDSPSNDSLLMLWSQESLAHLERICPLPTLLMTSLVTI